MFFPEQAKSWLRCRARCGSCCRRCSTGTPWQGAQRRKSGTRARSTTLVRSPPSPRSLARLAQPRHLGQTRILLKSARASDRGSDAADDRDDHERAACEESCRARRCEGPGETGPLRKGGLRIAAVKSPMHRRSSAAALTLPLTATRVPSPGPCTPGASPPMCLRAAMKRRRASAPARSTADKMSHSAMCRRAQPSKWKPRLA